MPQCERENAVKIAQFLKITRINQTFNFEKKIANITRAFNCKNFQPSFSHYLSSVCEAGRYEEKKIQC